MVGHRAYLACNGNPVFGWQQLGDCEHATGCGSGSCAPKWDVPSRWTGIVSGYRMDYCTTNPPRPPALPPLPPPPSPPPDGWCEQVTSSLLGGAQPANMLTSLVGVGLGLYMLAPPAALGSRATSAAAQSSPPSLHFRSGAALLVLTGLGSALHHWLPLSYWSHAADTVPMLLLACEGLAYAAQVLLKVAVRRCAGHHRPRAFRAASDLVLLLGWTVSALGLMAHKVEHYGPDHELRRGLGGAAGYVDHAAWLIGVIGATAACHVALFALALAAAAKGGRGGPDWKAARLVLPTYVGMVSISARCTYDGGHFSTRYLAILVFAGTAAAAQLTEYRGCPHWLYSAGLSVHAAWHVGIFLAVYASRSHSLLSASLWSRRGLLMVSARFTYGGGQFPERYHLLTVLRFLEARAAGSFPEWVGLPCRLAPPWLLFRVSAAKGGVVLGAGQAEAV